MTDELFGLFPSENGMPFTQRYPYQYKDNWPPHIDIKTLKREFWFTDDEDALLIEIIINKLTECFDLNKGGGMEKEIRLITDIYGNTLLPPTKYGPVVNIKYPDEIKKARKL